MSTQGKFIVLSGGEGSGKSTQAGKLAGWLKERGYDVLLTKEPGGDQGVCGDIRGILLKEDYKVTLDPRAELLLFWADRAQHVQKVIIPALKQGTTVVCDRFSPETYAYQHKGRGLCSTDEFLAFSEFSEGGTKPSIVLWLDTDPVTGLQRNVIHGKRDKFEREDLAFHERVRDGFEEYFSDIAKGAWEKIDASLPPDEVFSAIINAVSKRGIIR